MADGSQTSKKMLELLVGRLFPCTRQNTGRFVSVWLAGVTSVPEVTIVAEATVVLPSNWSEARSEQERGRLRPRSSSCAKAEDAARSATAAQRGARTAALRCSFMRASPFEGAPQVGDREIEDQPAMLVSIQWGAGFAGGSKMA